jgi:hypothetical protein
MIISRNPITLNGHEIIDDKIITDYFNNDMKNIKKMEYTTRIL